MDTSNKVSLTPRNLWKCSGNLKLCKSHLQLCQFDGSVIRSLSYFEVTLENVLISKCKKENSLFKK